MEFKLDNLMDLDTKENGKMTKDMVKEKWFLLTKIHMMGNGKMDSKREKGKISKIKIFY